MDPLKFFFFSFVSVLTIVNPIGGLITFVSLTSGVSEERRRRIAKRSVTIACVLAVIFAVSGELILRVFGITVDSLRIAGGILLFIVALNMLFGKASPKGVTNEEVEDASKREDISVFPIAMPLLTGPGTITTVIVLIRTGKTLGLKIIDILAILGVFAVTYLIFRFADRINRVLGVTGSLLVSRLMGLLLASIAVNFVAVGAMNIYKSLN
jgi:multiple antibiotic resistance protein